VHQSQDLVCFTDGSHHDGRTGAAFTVSYDGEFASELIPLGVNASVFQAEVLAISNLARELNTGF